MRPDARSSCQPHKNVTRFSTVIMRSKFIGEEKTLSKRSLSLILQNSEREANERRENDDRRTLRQNSNILSVNINNSNEDSFEVTKTRKKMLCYIRNGFE